MGRLMTTRRVRKGQEQMLVGYYASRGYCDSSEGPRFTTRELRCWIPAKLQYDDDAMWRACQEDLKKRWPIKGEFKPSVNEMWPW